MRRTCGFEGSRGAGWAWGFVRAALVAFVVALVVVAGACAGGGTSGDAPNDGERDPDAAGAPSIAPPGVDATTPPPSHDAAPASDAHGRDAAGSNDAPTPTLTSIAPSQVVVGSGDTTVVATGAGFVARSVLQIDGVPLPTSFVSETELRATVPATSLATVRALHVSVGTAPPGGGASVDLAFDVVDPVPSITSLSPSSVPVGAAATTLTVNGASFVAGAKVAFDGVDLATTFVGATKVTAVVPAAKLAASGSFAVTVTNPAPGGGASSAIAFIVTNPTVSVASVTPSSAIVGAASTAIALVGGGFVAASSVSFNGAALPSSVSDAQHMTATIPASALTKAGDFPVVVTNPAPGGGVSTPVPFHVVYPAPVATSLSPSGALVGSAPPTITVTGSGFVAGATTIAIDGVAAATTVVDATHASATLTTSQLATAKTLQVTVVNPTPGGGSSAALPFEVGDPVPAIASVSPSSALEGSPDLTVTISGSGFVAASQAKIGATALATTVAGATQLTAVIPASMLAAAATLSITVESPAPGGGASNAASFVVARAVPTLTAVAPTSIAITAGATTITLAGSGFDAASVVKCNGVAIASTTQSATSIGAVVPAATIAAGDTLSLTVTNPAPGGGTSNALTIAIACDTSGVDVALGALSQPKSVATNFASTTAPKARRIIVSGGSAACPATVDSTTTLEPYRAVVVQNTSGQSATLAAWAVCAQLTDDAFLTFYRGATLPSDLEQCTGVVAEGADGTGGFDSPDANGATYCPGLTKGAGGLTLPACGKAVVLIQAYSMTSTSYTPPGTLRFELE